MASKNTSNQTCENENDNQWPRFLIMEAADEKVPLNLNAFVLKKAIDGMANAELDNVKPMKSGSSSIGRVFRSLVRWKWKMAALPLPVAILDDLISGSRKWGHPRWRPEAEGPPFSTSTSLGIEKRAPGPGWRHFRPRQLGSKMATAEMMSGGRRDAREDVLQTSAPSMSPVEVWLYWKHLIISLTQALSKWLSELPACYYAEVISLHMSKVVKNLRLQQAPTLLFWILFYFIFLTVLYNSLELLYSTVS